MKIFLLLILSLSVLFLTACTSIGYYLDAVNGHLNILSEQERITDILEKDDISPELRSKLVLATEVRNFASSEMLLPDNDSYRYYSDIKRPYAVWNVVATEKFSIAARQWCFFVVGCVSYRGYFSQDDAKSYAKTLAAQGYDVNVSGARAYSTLGWFDDPLLNTMIKQNEARLVGIIIHELAHQQIYIDDDSSFNEAFASSVEIEGIKRWFKHKKMFSQQQKKTQFETYLRSRQREVEFKQMLKAAQVKLDALFNSNEFKNSDNKTALKRDVFRQLHQHYQVLKKSWNNYAGYDDWMTQDLNNAHLALVATYFNKVPAFQAILKASDNNLKLFYQVIDSVAGLNEKQRNHRLSEYQRDIVLHK